MTTALHLSPVHLHEVERAIAAGYRLTEVIAHADKLCIDLVAVASDPAALLEPSSKFERRIAGVGTMGTTLMKLFIETSAEAAQAFEHATGEKRIDGEADWDFVFRVGPIMAAAEDVAAYLQSNGVRLVV